MDATILDLESLEILGNQKCRAFSRDGRRIATVTRSNEAVISQVDGKQGIPLAPHDATVAGLLFSPDGTRIATFDIESNIVVSDTVSGERISTWNLRPEGIESIQFSPDGSKIVTLSFLSDLKVWDVTSGQLIRSFRESEIERVSKIRSVSSAGPGPYSAHQFFAFSPDSTRLVSASGSHKVTVWNLDTGQEAAFRTPEPLSFVAFKPGAEHQVLYATRVNLESAIVDPASDPGRSDSVVKLYSRSLFSQHESRLLYSPGSFYKTAAVNHTGTQIASFSAPMRGRTNAIKIWNLQTGVEEMNLPWDWEAGGQLFGAAFSPDDSLLAVASRNKGVGIVNLATQEIRHLRNAGLGELVTFCRDGERILVSRSGIYDVQSGESLVRFQGANPGWVMAFNADESRVATGGERGTVGIWNAATGDKVLDLSKKESELDTDDDNVSWVAFSPDSGRLAAADWRGHVLVWDALSGEPLLKFLAHQGRAYTVSFSPDGKRLVSMGDDGVLRVWDSYNGREILTLTGHADRVYHATFTSDGSQIVSTSADGTIRIWDGRPITE